MGAYRSLYNSKYIKLLGHVGALITVTAWGNSFLSTKVLMADGGMTPVEVFVYRFATAYLLLLLFTLKKIKSNSWNDELIFIICGICSGSLYFITENYALQYTSTGNVSLLSSVSPIFTILLVCAVYRIRLGIGQAIGSLIAFMGVFCVIFSHGEGFVIQPKGDLLALCASLSWAVYTMLVKRVTPNYSSFFITRKLFFYGMISAVPLLLLQNEPLHLSILFDWQQPKFILNFAFLVLMCSVLAYVIWNECLNILGSVTTNNYIYMQPLVTMISAYLLLAEVIYPLGYLGCVLIVGGLVISDKWHPHFRLKRK